MTSPIEPAHLVLLAEDEEHIARLVQFKLGRSGFAVLVARDGREALEALRTRTFALVILDVMMPFHDGWEVLRRLRGELGLTSVPVLMLTAKGYQQDQVNAAELGATSFLKKPFDPDELAGLVRRLVGAGP